MKENTEIEIQDQCTLKMLSFFVPIEVKHLHALDDKFHKMNYNLPQPKNSFFNIYNSILENNLMFNIHNCTWNHILSINFNLIDNRINNIKIKLFRFSEKFFFIKFDFELSDNYLYEFWHILRRRVTKVEIKKDRFTEVLYPPHIQKELISFQLLKIEHELSDIIDQYFGDISFYSTKYHKPCLRTFFYDNDSKFKINTSFFWSSIGLEDNSYERYFSDDHNIILAQSRKDDQINIFIKYKLIERQPMYYSIESQIYDFIDTEIYPAIGPGLAVSEIFNYLYSEYRNNQNTKKLYRNLKKASMYNELLYYINEFTNDVSENLFAFQEVMLLPLTKWDGIENYTENLKHKIQFKQKILLDIYNKEFSYVQNLTTINLNRYNFYIQVGMVFITIISILIALVALWKS